MDRDAKILSLIAATMFAAGLGVIAFNHYYSPAAAAVGAAANEDPADAEVAAGKMAADFRLPDLAGAKVSLSSLRGKVVFLNVWATWCGPCREEMPSIEALYEDFRDNPDFVVLAVSQDSEGRGAVDSYVRKNGLKFTVLLDPKNDVGDAYDVSGIPETFIIDRAGRIVAHHIGPYDWAQPKMRSALKDLIESRDDGPARTAKAG